MGAMLECHTADDNRIPIFSGSVNIHNFYELQECIQVWRPIQSNCNFRNYGPDNCLSGPDIKDKTKGIFAFLSPRGFAGKSTGNDCGEVEALESLTKFFLLAPCQPTFCAWPVSALRLAVLFSPESN